MLSCLSCRANVRTQQYTFPPPTLWPTHAAAHRSTLVIASDHLTLMGALDALTASPLQSVELEAEEIVFTDDSGASYTDSRWVGGDGWGSEYERVCVCVCCRHGTTQLPLSSTPAGAFSNLSKRPTATPGWR